MSITCPCCGSPKAVVKKYVGSIDTYNYCPECMHTWGGEETPAKKALIRDACRANVTEQDEVEGKVWCRRGSSCAGPPTPSTANPCRRGSPDAA